MEYINGMEVVKVFNRDGESYKRFEQDVPVSYTHLDVYKRQLSSVPSCGISKCWSLLPEPD